MAEAWPETEQELALRSLYGDLDKLMRKAEKLQRNPDKLHTTMQSVTAKLKEAKAQLKEFEREARTDGMPVPLMQERKKALSDQLNGFIAKKRDLVSSATHDELFVGAVKKEEDNIEMMSSQQLMQRGKKDIQEMDATLNRAERLAEDIVATGTNTAGALHDQTNQLNKIVDDLADIEFNLKKATKVITDITRGLLTDKCIGFLLFLAVGGVIAIIVVKVVNPNKKNISSGLDSINNATGIGGLFNSLVNSTTNLVSSGVNSAVGSLPSGNTVGRRHLRGEQHEAHPPQDLLSMLLQDDAF